MDLINEDEVDLPNNFLFRVNNLKVRTQSKNFIFKYYIVLENNDLHQLWLQVSKIRETKVRLDSIHNRMAHIIVP